MKIVADTNTLISALFWTGNERNIINLVEEGRLELLITREILNELENVLTRDHFKLKLDDVDANTQNVLDKMISISTIINPNEKIDVIKDDPDDNKFLECALSGKADCIVSGDSHLLNLREFRGMKIIKSSTLLQILK